jgi:hypothetical protein
MNLTDEAPKIKPWPFIVGDVVLLGTAAFIASQSPTPLGGTSLLAIVGPVALGAVLACIPFLLNYTRRQDLVLAERQNEIAALARTTAESAEQIGISAQGLQSINELTQRALKHLDQLPHKLQDKINDFKSQLNEVAVNENEVLAQEVNTLRASEIERLETAFASVRKTAMELSTLEAATRQHLAEINQSLLRFSTAAERAASDTAAAIETGRTHAEHALTTAQDNAAAAFERAVARALTVLETRLNSLAILPPSASNHSPQPAAFSSPPIVPTSLFPSHPPTEQTASAEEPPPSFERPPEISPVTSQPPAAAAMSAPPSAADEPSSAVVRKRPPRKALVRDDDQPSLSLDLAELPGNGEYSQLPPEDNSPAPAVSSGCVTRLLVTAYIGIGNKLYVRGEGPGLSWEKGVPLQFVSIGKWRWETPDASESLTLRLYKNDEQECVSLGEFTLAPGHQQEVHASF